MKVACTLLFVLLSAALLEAQSRVLPFEAITWSRYLDKAEFDQRFPGEPLDAQGRPRQDGWYVLYEHKALQYYYGPTGSRNVAELYREELAEVVSEAQAKRESLREATIRIVRVPDELPGAGQGGSGANGSSAPGAGMPGPESWWQKLFRILR